MDVDKMRKNGLYMWMDLLPHDFKKAEEILDIKYEHCLQLILKTIDKYNKAMAEKPQWRSICQLKDLYAQEQRRISVSIIV